MFPIIYKHIFTEDHGNVKFSIGALAASIRVYISRLNEGSLNVLVNINKTV